MPRTNLVYIRGHRQVVAGEAVAYERVKAFLQIAGQVNLRTECLVDTGSILTMFPEKVWRPFAPLVTWLYVATSLPDWLIKATGLGAASIPCALGKVAIQIVDLHSRTLSPAIEIIAKLAHDNGLYPQVLLGLGGGAFKNWNLVVDSANAEAWLDY